MAVQQTILTQISPPQHKTFSVGWLLRLAAMVGFLITSRAQSETTNNKPAMFVLGDSLFDNGNNNYLVTLAKSNFLPNGLDFQFGPTGRFCNGRTVADVLAQKMGVPYPPSYLNPRSRGPAILQGLNYASAAAGILDSTGFNFIGRIPFNKQLGFVANTKSQFVQLIGASQTDEIFSTALWYLTIGSNDYINNYLVKGSQTSQQYTPQQYHDVLVATFEQHMRRLYALGARKIVVFGVGPLGCIPSQLFNQKSSDGICIEFVNSYVRDLNAATKALLNRLTASLQGSIFLYGNAYNLIASYVANPGAFGFTTVNKGCCGLGPYNGAVPCIPTIRPCPDRSAYLFWDPYHPTDRTNMLLANAAYSGGLDVIEPMNIEQLASLAFR